jgi:ABC-2 type transport system permease protein
VTRALVTHADAAAAVMKRDILVFRSYRLRLVSQLVTGLPPVALTYYISRLVSVKSFSNPDEYFAYAVIGFVILQVLYSTVGTLPARVRQELVAGTFERFVVSPFGAAAAVVSMTVFPFVLALVGGASTIAFAVLVFGMPMHWPTVGLGVPLAVFGCLSFAPFALLGAAAVIFVKQAQSATSLAVTGISFIAGFLFPVSLLPGWIRWMSEVQPFTPTVDLLRHVLAGSQLQAGLTTELLKMGVSAAVLLPAAVWVLSSAIRLSQRRGTIIEY